MTFEASAPVVCDSAWVSPEGKWFRVTCGEHSKFAEQQLGSEVPSPVRALEQRGWVHISSMYFYIGKSPTESQINTMWDWHHVMVDAGKTEWATFLLHFVRDPDHYVQRG